MLRNVAPARFGCPRSRRRTGLECASERLRDYYRRVRVIALPHVEHTRNSCSRYVAIVLLAEDAKLRGGCKCKCTYTWNVRNSVKSGEEKPCLVGAKMVTLTEY